MDLAIKELGKLYANHWIFKDLSYHIASGSRWGIKGHNGAGKSTLIKMILGLTLPTKGQVVFQNNGGEVSRDDWASHISFTAAYAKIFTEFRAGEFLKHAQKFRAFHDGLTIEEIIETARLKDHTMKSLDQYSTGMLQRFKLTLTLCTKSEIVILDEPTSNLDVAGKKWFQELLHQKLGERTLILASNEEDDFEQCSEFIDLNQSVAL